MQLNENGKITVTLIATGNCGQPRKIEVQEETTLKNFVAENAEQAYSKYRVEVEGRHITEDVADRATLEDGDIVSITPINIKGA